MSTLRISDAPLLPDVDGTEKIPTGGRGDYAVSIDQIKGHIFQDIGKELVGLGNVDNTSDLDKPVSTAQQAALNLKANKTYVDVNLDLKADKTNVYTRTETSLALSRKADLVNGVVPENQIPSSFNDVLEFTTTNLPIIGESGKIYVTTDTNKTWRWSGNQYVEISNGGISDSTLKLQTPRKIANVDFDGTQNIDIPHNNLTNRNVANAHAAEAINTATGEDQQTINDYNGAKWRNKSGGYDLNARVMLENGDIVKSIVAGNTVDPNIDMTGWILIGGEWVDVTNLLIVNDPLARTWNSTVINNAITKAKAEKKGVTCAPKGTVYAEGDLDFKSIQYIKFYSDILNSTGTVIVGGFSNTANPVDITFQRITNGTSAINGAIPNIDVFRIEGVKAGVVSIGQTNLLRVHAVGGSSTGGSNAYFSINLGGSVRAFRVSDEGVDGWNNEFVVSGGRIIDLDVTGTGYTPNNIIFDNNVFEGALVKIRFKNAWTNRITNARFENVSNAPGVFFDTDTMQNTVIQRWNGSGSPRGMFEFSPKVADLGKGNQCTTQSAVEFNNIELFSVSANSGIVSNGSSSACLDARIGRTKAGLVSKNVLQPALTGFTAQGSRLIALSDVVEVQNGDAINFDCDYAGNLIRPLVYVFDQNMRAITDAASDEVLLAGSAFSPIAAAFETTADRSATTLRNGLSINSDRIKYVQVGCYSSSGGFFRHLSATLFTQKLLRNKAISELSASQVIPNIAGKPTSGFVSVGTKLFDTTVRELISCTDALDTYITSATNSSTVNVSRNTGLKVGAIAGVIQVDGTTEWALINSISGNDITLSKSVNVSAGARFVANSWAYDKPVNSVAYNPPSIAVGGNVTTTVMLTGVSTGNNVSAAFSQYHPDIEIIAAISSVDTVTVKFKNVGASAVDLASGTLTVKMI